MFNFNFTKVFSFLNEYLGTGRCCHTHINEITNLEFSHEFARTSPLAYIYFKCLFIYYNVHGGRQSLTNKTEVKTDIRWHLTPFAIHLASDNLWYFVTSFIRLSPDMVNQFNSNFECIIHLLWKISLENLILQQFYERDPNYKQQKHLKYKYYWHSDPSLAAFNFSDKYLNRFVKCLKYNNDTELYPAAMSFAILIVVTFSVSFSFVLINEMAKFDGWMIIFRLDVNNSTWIA